MIQALCAGGRTEEAVSTLVLMDEKGRIPSGLCFDELIKELHARGRLFGYSNLFGYAVKAVDDAIRKTIEDIIPIATGHEREEIEADLQGKNLLDINYPEGPFGTKDLRFPNQGEFIINYNKFKNIPTRVKIISYLDLFVFL
ncbi:hypothetical protein K1719_020877 [Acacia pycnantha]|nr:hypothetical protein K1719_020877 [Acacia pycnantha]